MESKIKKVLSAVLHKRKDGKPWTKERLENLASFIEKATEEQKKCPHKRAVPFKKKFMCKDCGLRFRHILKRS